MKQDWINHPKHYTAQPIECIEITEHLNFNLGNAVKYLWRYKDKNGSEDLKKARWYLNRELVSGRAPHRIALPKAEWLLLCEELTRCDFSAHQGMAMAEIIFWLDGKKDGLVQAVRCVNQLLDEWETEHGD